jgi:hypothetical protein
MTVRRLTAFAATAALILALAACGGGGSKNSATKTATNTTPRSTVTPAGQATPQSGATPVLTPISAARATYQVQFTVAADPANILPLVERRGHALTRLTVTLGNGTVSINASKPFIEVTGTIDAGGTFTATGTGTIDPYDNVEATFQGTIINGQLTGTYAVGTNGALPGRQPLTYNVTGTRQVPTAGA